MRPTWLTFVVEDRLLEDRFGEGGREVEHYSRPRAHQSRQIVFGTRFYSSPLMRFFEESGCISLMVFENDTPMSTSPVVKYLSLEPPYNSSPIFVVPLARVTAREVIPAMLAKVDRERSQHLISRTAPRAQSACVATSSDWYLEVLRDLEAFLLHWPLPVAAAALSYQCGFYDRVRCWMKAASANGSSKQQN
ncbi:hypothetical protein BGY98DRAFT_935083 [Russula aff. rugulosa BPL654]|nr:hypothetical protein BGY98DRAFT_935083 [Russula aff. rugulosa BPL654]